MHGSFQPVFQSIALISRAACLGLRRIVVNLTAMARIHRCFSFIP
jgi:hypothetical protein